MGWNEFSIALQLNPEFLAANSVCTPSGCGRFVNPSVLLLRSTSTVRQFGKLIIYAIDSTNPSQVIKALPVMMAGVQEPHVVSRLWVSSSGSQHMSSFIHKLSCRLHGLGEDQHLRWNIFRSLLFSFQFDAPSALALEQPRVVSFSLMFAIRSSRVVPATCKGTQASMKCRLPWQIGTGWPDFYCYSLYLSELF